jgi:hypothetical protein
MSSKLPTIFSQDSTSKARRQFETRRKEAFRIGEEEMTSCTWDPRFTRVNEHSCTFSRE